MIREAVLVLTRELYEHVRARLAGLGFGDDYAWSQSVRLPTTPEAFACEYVWVVLNSGMRSTVARKIMDRVWPRLLSGASVSGVFGHRGKSAAIESVWRHRAEYFACLAAVATGADLVSWCETLPWIGKITKFHLAKNLGADVAKPDRWLERLARAEGETVDELCGRLARETGDRVATVDVVLWRACSVGVLSIVDDVVVAHLGDATSPE